MKFEYAKLYGKNLTFYDNSVANESICDSLEVHICSKNSFQNKNN